MHRRLTSEWNKISGFQNFQHRIPMWVSFNRHTTIKNSHNCWEILQYQNQRQFHFREKYPWILFHIQCWGKSTHGYFSRKRNNIYHINYVDFTKESTDLSSTMIEREYFTINRPKYRFFPYRIQFHFREKYPWILFLVQRSRKSIHGYFSRK